MVIRLDDKPDIEYQVELQKFNGDVVSFYRIYEHDIDNVQRYFRMYALGVLPDLSQWKDVTSEIWEKVAQQQKKSASKASKEVEQV